MTARRNRVIASLAEAKAAAHRAESQGKMLAADAAEVDPEEPTLRLTDAESRELRERLDKVGGGS